MSIHHRFLHADDWRTFPMAFWVHVPQGTDWLHAAIDGDYLPPAPRRIPGKGYPVLAVEVEDETLLFSSPAQLQVFLDTLATKPRPSTRRLSELRGANHGPNSHWLSRLPAWMKGPGFRDKILPKLRRLQQEIAVEAAATGWR